MHSVKIISSIFLLLVVIVGASLFTTRILYTTSEKLQIHIGQVEKNTYEDDWGKVKESLDAFENDWSKTEKTWATLIDHIEIDQIDNTLSRLTMFVETEDKSMALAEASALKKYIQHIPEKEALILKNLF